MDTIFKLGVDGHASSLLAPNVRELAEIGFDEIIVQGIFDAGLDAGVATIRRLREALDAWIHDDPAVVFPAGTYLMRVLHGAPCAALG